jgi:hypothetical protein
MSIFQLPISLCKELNSLMQEFWWRHLSKSSRINWMSWDRMSYAKSNKGLGFRDLVIFNQAILAKQGWRLIQHPSSLVANIFSVNIAPPILFWRLPWVLGLLLFGGVFSKPKVFCRGIFFGG